LWCPFEQRWLPVEVYPTTDAQGSVIAYTTDEITVLCVDNEGMEEFLTVGETYIGKFENPLPFKNGHWIEINTGENTIVALPHRFVIITK
jgi:hypothetical protein